MIMMGENHNIIVKLIISFVVCQWFNAEISSTVNPCFSPSLESGFVIILVFFFCVLFESMIRFRFTSGSEVKRPGECPTTLRTVRIVRMSWWPEEAQLQPGPSAMKSIIVSVSGSHYLLPGSLPACCWACRSSILWSRSPGPPARWTQRPRPS